MRKLLVLFGAVLSLTLIGCETNAQNGFKDLSSEELSEVLQNKMVQLIDVRTPKEYTAEHIKTSININFFAATFPKEIEALDKEKPVYVYCRSGKRSVKSIALFKEAGFKEIYNLKGGILDWKSKEFEVEKVKN
ncbi:rhodanese-like domain-containing protein [Seonamhaeicola marinus]|nr:rhodanese-like domain-containing protein [Seonamhaeicola marinus]